MEDTLKLWEKVKLFQQCGIVYQMGEERIPVDASVVCDWIKLEEDGSFALDEQGDLQLREDAVEEFVDALAKEYDTVGGSRQFKATRGEIVTASTGINWTKRQRQSICGRPFSQADRRCTSRCIHRKPGGRGKTISAVRMWKWIWASR